MAIYPRLLIISTRDHSPFEYRGNKHPIYLPAHKLRGGILQVTAHNVGRRVVPNAEWFDNPNPALQPAY